MGKSGRPRLYSKRQNISFRLTEETKQRLVQSALANGRSLSEEIEFHINRDFLLESLRSVDKK